MHKREVGVIYVPVIRNPEVMSAANVRYELVNAVVDYNIDDHQFELVRSVIDGTADVISYGEFFNGSINYYNMTLAVNNALKALQGKVVRLWPFGVGEIPGTFLWYPWVDVVLTSVRPYHKKNAYYLDALIMEFESQKPYTLARASASGLPAET